MTDVAIGYGIIGLGIYVSYKCIKGVLNFHNPLRHQNVKVVSTPEECRKIVRLLRKDTKKYKVLGFDCEWVSEYRRRQPVAFN